MDPWMLLAASGNPRLFLATPGSSWQLFVVPGVSWHRGSGMIWLLGRNIWDLTVSSLDTPGSSWLLLATPGSSGQLLVTHGSSWHPGSGFQDLVSRIWQPGRGIQRLRMSKNQNEKVEWSERLKTKLYQEVMFFLESETSINTCM